MVGGGLSHQPPVVLWPTGTVRSRPLFDRLVALASEPLALMQRGRREFWACPSVRYIQYREG